MWGLFLFLGGFLSALCLYPVFIRARYYQDDGVRVVDVHFMGIRIWRYAW
jgi:hypothetical protein